MTDETKLANWPADLARDGVVRIRPRRRVAAVRTLLFGFVLANQVGSIVSAALGRQSWMWYPLFSVVSVPLFGAMVWMFARMCLLGRPVLVVDAVGVSLGRKRLAWNAIDTIAKSRGRYGFVTIAPARRRRMRQITVGRDHVQDVPSLAAWLDALRTGYGSPLQS